MEFQGRQAQSTEGSSGVANRPSAVFLTPTATIENLVDLSPEVKDCVLDDEVRFMGHETDLLGVMPDFPIKQNAKSEDDWEIDLRGLSGRDAHLRIAKTMDRNMNSRRDEGTNDRQSHRASNEWEIDLRGLSEREAHDRINKIPGRAGKKG